jgi:hypothetical protein
VSAAQVSASTVVADFDLFRVSKEKPVVVGSLRDRQTTTGHLRLKRQKAKMLEQLDEWRICNCQQSVKRNLE